MLRRMRLGVAVATLVAATMLVAGVPAHGQTEPTLTIRYVPASQAKAVQSGHIGAAALPIAGACAFYLNQGSAPIFFGVNNHYAIGQIACLLAPPAGVAFGWIKISELNGPAVGEHASAPSTGYKLDSVTDGTNYHSNRVRGILRDANYRAYLIAPAGFVWVPGPVTCLGYLTNFLTCDFHRYFG